MQIKIGETIKQLRRRDGRTQENLAAALGVTSQAVSRWESGGSYPDLEMIPSIANYFGITIDALFGYENDRSRKVDSILQKVDSFHLKYRSDDEWVDECLAILREGLAEFPQNETLMFALADTLSEAGWRRQNDWLYYNDDGYMQHSYDPQKRNTYWVESAKLCENLVENASDHSIVSQAISLLVLLYRNFGDSEKAISFANRMPALTDCRESLLANATEGTDEAMYIGDLLLKLADQLAEYLVYGLIANQQLYTTDLPIRKIQGILSLFDLLCDDGNLGPYHYTVDKLYLYLSRLQWEQGFHDEAFASLDAALTHARAYEALCDGQEHSFTAPLLSFVKFRIDRPKDVVKALPSDWPFWCNPDYSQVAREMQADPRWADWVSRTQQPA